MVMPMNLFFEIIGLILVGGGVYVSLTKEITTLKTRLDEREKHQDTMSKDIGSIKTTMNEILIKLENKANR